MMTMKIRINNKGIAFTTLFLTLCLIASQSLGVHAACAVLMLIPLLMRLRKVRYNWFEIVSALFFCYLALSFLWARIDELTVIGARSIFVEYSIVLISIMLLISVINEDTEISTVIHIINVANLIYCVYVFFSTPISEWGRTYIGDSIGIGKNAVGTRCAWGILYASYLFRVNRKKKLFYLLCFALNTLFVAFSGSRKAVIIAILGLVLMQIVLGDNKKRIRNVLIGCIILILSYYFMTSNALLYRIIGNRLELFLNGILNGVNKNDGSWMERNYYKAQAMDMFYQKPIYGFGINGFMVNMKRIGYYHVAYSHCNYTELLANYGLIGFSLFYIPRIVLVIYALKNKQYKKSKLHSVVFSSMLIQFVIDYELVSYYSLISQLPFCLAGSLFLKDEPYKATKQMKDDGRNDAAK